MDEEDIDSLAKKVEAKRSRMKNIQSSTVSFSEAPLISISVGDSETSTSTSTTVSPNIKYSITNLSSRLYTNGKIFEKFDWLKNKEERRKLVEKSYKSGHILRLI